MPDPGQTTIIGADTKIKGEMTFENTARLLGHFEGKIHAKGELQVADAAQCRASVEAGKVIVDGLLEGNVTAKERLELTGKAKMKGDVSAARLVVADGASLVGHVAVGPDAGKLGGAAHTPTAVEPKPEPRPVPAPGR